jgi:hypothetical protein
LPAWPAAHRSMTSSMTAAAATVSKSLTAA